MIGGGNIYSKFEMLSNEKKQKILNAGMKEFSLKHFKNASTDKIAADAGISKGALFHYFGTKKDLFLYLYRYVKTYMETEYKRCLTTLPQCENEEQKETDDKAMSYNDPIGVLISLTKTKIEILNVHPDMYNFFVNIYVKENDAELQKLIHEDADSLREDLLSQLFPLLDYSYFKDEFDPEHVMNIIRWVIDGFSSKIIMQLESQSDTFDKINDWTREYNTYMEILKKLFYK